MLTNSSFKLQKLTKSMEFRSDSFSKDSTVNTPRIASMNSVAKSVKYNNLSFITGEQLCKLRRQPEEGIQDPQYSTAHNNMANIRKRFDKTNQQKLYLQNKIDRLAEESNKYKAIQKQFQDNKINGKQKVIDYEGELQRIKLQLMNKDFQKKSYQQMVGCIVHDKIVYDKRKFDMQKYLKNLHFKQKTIKDQFIHKNQQDDRVVKVYEKLINQLDKEDHQRQQHINSLEGRIIQRQSINNSSVLRKSQMELIAEEALTDRDPHEKQWTKVFLTHTMLEKMLKSKIQREMSKFSTVQQAFKQIKIATGVSDASTMVKKFLSKQEIYGDLLSKIASNEREILILKKQQQNYQRQIKKHEQQINLMDTGKINAGGFRQQLKQAQSMEDKRKRCYLKQKKMRQFLFKQYNQLKQNMKTADVNEQIENQPQEKKEAFDLRTKEQIKNRFVKYLSEFSKFIDDSLTLEANQNSSSIMEIAKDQQIVNKIFRVKPQVQKKMAYNASGRQQDNPQSLYIENYQQEYITNGNQQQYSLEEQRLNTIKVNQKFMRQLRMKRQEEKRLLVENIVKNNKQKAAPVPVKKVQAPVQ